MAATSSKGNYEEWRKSEYCSRPNKNNTFINKGWGISDIGLCEITLDIFHCCQPLDKTMNLLIQKIFGRLISYENNHQLQI